MFEGKNLSGRDLSGSDFNHQNLTDTDLSGADLSLANLWMADLRGACLRGANMRGAHLLGAKLDRADLSGANLEQTNLCYADLTTTALAGVNLRFSILLHAELQNVALAGAKLGHSELVAADLSNADLSNASLRTANLSRANLRNADLGGATLVGTNFTSTDLTNANLSDARLGRTSFSATILTGCTGLETCVHQYPSTVDGRTIEISGGLPEEFLRRCGLHDWEIKVANLYDQNLQNTQISELITEINALRGSDPIQIYQLFISYNHNDGVFVDQLGKELDNRGLRYWRDVDHAISGPLDEIVIRELDRSVVILILSENSVGSDWVEYEAKTARRVEKEQGRNVLCPIALDTAWRSCEWPGSLRNQIEKYNILDFSDWQDDASFSKAINKLLDGNDLFYQFSKNPE